ncbi:uncharacterized protein L201_001485 [Kwoniella dendrophila CBS 6074]|uniref:DUF38 domain-containing protein n=1 Tax=Kwoniella dendrophila CBS 6074 TaxID=1295534 RepID=A0AAX4JQ67_9TREE
MEKRIKFLRDRGMSNGPSQLWKYKINRMISEEIIFPNLKQINVSKSCFILNSPPTHDQSEDICIEEEELDKLEKQFMKIKDLFRILPIKKDIYLDMLDSDIPVKRLIKLFEVIFTTFNPSTMVIRSSHTLMPMSLPYIHHITNVKLYLEMDAPNLMDISEDEKEEIISDFRGFEWRTLTSSGARRETKERPIEVYLKNQNLLDVLEEISLLNDKNDEDKKIIKLFKWDKEEDWLK